PTLDACGRTLGFSSRRRHTDRSAMAKPDFAASSTVKPLTSAEEKIDLPSPAPREHKTAAAPTILQRVAAVGSIRLVLVFAFLASSFSVRNSDYWFHLATGRSLARGEYQFGVDPFALTTAGVYWVNHSWLFDVSLYLVREATGDASLVVVKALLVALLAG